MANFGLLFLTYYILVIPFRTIYREEFTFSDKFLGLVVVDYICDLYFLCEPFLKIWRKRSRSVEPFSGDMIDRNLVPVTGSYFWPSRRNLITIAGHLVCFFPFEVFVWILTGRYVSYLRILKLVKIGYLMEYWQETTTFLSNSGIITNVKAHRALFLALISFYFVHVGACGFFAAAVSGMLKNDQPTWLTVGGFAEVAINNSGERVIVYLRPMMTLYLKSCYWSIVTFATVGYGDIVAHTTLETWFCIIYFFIAGVVMYFALANFALLICDSDAGKVNYLRKLSQFEGYAAYRKLPLDIVRRVRSYYEHQWNQLSGMHESQVLAELPPNLEEQVLQQVIRNRLKEVELFRKFSLFVLNSLSGFAEIRAYGPADTIIDNGSQISGLFIVCSGEIEVIGKITNILQILRQGQIFGINSLTKSYASTSEVKAKSFCEIIFLSGSHYRHVMKGALSPREYSALLKNNAERKDSVAACVDADKCGPGILSRTRRAALRGPSTSHIQLAVTDIGWRKHFVEGSIGIVYWEVIKLGFLIFYSLSIPLLLGGMMRDGFYGAYHPLLVTGYVIDIFLVCDIAMSCSLVGYVINGEVVVNSKKILQNFLNTHNLVVVFLANFPIDIIFALIFGVRVIPVLRLLKLFHFHRFEAYSKSLNYFISTVLHWNISFEFGRYILLYCCLYLLCHWFGCIYLLCADVGPKVFHFSRNWKPVTGLSNYSHVDYGWMNGWTDYFRSIYWALSGMTTVGYFDMTPSNPLETIYTIFFLYLGCQLYNALDSSIASLISNFDKNKREFQSKVDRAKQIIRYRRVSFEIEARILRYYEYSWSRYSGIDESSVLKTLPKSLRSTVTGYVVGRIVEEIPFFRDCSEPMIQMIISLLEPRTFLPNDPVVVFGEHGKEMFIIERGVVQVTSANREIVYATLKNGSYFGESCLLEVGKRTASAFAVGYCDTFVLSKENFIKAAETFPTEYQDIVESIKQVLLEKKKQNTAKSEGSKKLIPAIKSISSDSTENNTPQLKAFLKRDWVSAMIHPDSLQRNLWESILFLCLVYYLASVPLRIGYRLPAKFYVIDYVIDVMFGIDCFLNWTVFPIFSGGELLSSITELRKIYMRDRFLVDIVAMIPYDVFMFAFSTTFRPFAHALLRVPKLLRGLWISHYVKRIEAACEELGINFALFRFVELIGLLLIVGIYLDCIYYMMANLANLEPCIPEEGALYGVACRYKNTWMQLQIWWNRVPPNGGDQMDRFFLALSWAITTLNKETMAAVMPGNAKESFYVFWVMFFGLTVNGLVLGSAISLISDFNVETVGIHRKKDSLELHIHKMHFDVPVELIMKCTSYLTYLTSEEGVYVRKQEAFVSELPHSLRVLLDSFLKTTPFLKTCPVFDFCSDEMLRGISSRMRMQMFAIGDRIINCGEMGKEMYFIDQGSVSVVSGDEKTVYTSIHSGGFFGETALFFKSPRTATIKALSNVCICYILEKVDLDAEVSSFEFDIEATIMAFKKLQDSNSRRNAALSSNLKSLNTPGSKLSKVLGTTDRSKDDEDLPLLTKIRLKLSPRSRFRTVWNVLGFLFLVYYALTIPFNIAFLVGNDLESRIEKTLYVDFLIDAYWVVDIILKSFIFSYYGTKLSTLLVTDGESIWRRYLHRHFRIDMLSSLPLEIFALIPGLPRISVFILRLQHLGRLLQAGEYMERIEIRILEAFGWLPRRSALSVYKAASIYCLVTHWFGCIFFMIHRYIDIRKERTFAVVDGMASYNYESHHHTICSTSMIRCYSRCLYTALSLVTSVGYGDLMSYGNNELAFEIVMSVGGSLLAAMFSAYCGAYLADIDAAGDFHFKSKLSLISKYVSFRNLTPDLSQAVLEQYKYLWKKERATGDDDGILRDLTIPTQIDVKYEINKSTLLSIPIVLSQKLSIQKRIAYFMNPLICLPDSIIYAIGDVGRALFFVSKGKVTVNIASDNGDIDSFGYEALPLLRQKEQVHGREYGPGDHFGEYCLISASGLRPDHAISRDLSELFYVNEDDLWTALSFATWADRKKFLFDMMTRVGEICHTPATFNPSTESIESIKSFHRVSLTILEEIVDSASEQLRQFSDENGDVKRRNLMSAGSFMGSSAVLTLRPKASFSAQSLTGIKKDIKSIIEESQELEKPIINEEDEDEDEDENREGDREQQDGKEELIFNGGNKVESIHGSDSEHSECESICAPDENNILEDIENEEEENNVELRNSSRIT